VIVVLFHVFWALLGYLTFHGGVSAANKRLPQSVRSALAPDKGSLLTNSTSILLLGTDHSLAVSRAGEQHSDSITLLRTDPSHHRLYYLSIPRDLRVQIPGYGDARSTPPSRSAGHAWPRARSPATRTSPSTT
jgi:anionic cell wall polymer biosynthesis LytR-Cps2A-Psr (LCP) family protein